MKRLAVCVLLSLAGTSYVALGFGCGGGSAGVSLYVTPESPTSPTQAEGPLFRFLMRLLLYGSRLQYNINVPCYSVRLRRPPYLYSIGSKSVDGRADEQNRREAGEQI